MVWNKIFLRVDGYVMFCGAHVLGLYYGITIAIVSFATAMTSFTLNIHHKGSTGYPVPHFVKFICFKLLARVLCLKIHLPHEPLVSLVSICNLLSVWLNLGKVILVN